MTPSTVSEEMEKMIILGQIREKPILSDNLISLFPVHIKNKIWNKKHSSQLIFELYTKRVIEVKRINHQNRFVITASGERYFQEYSEAFKLLYLRYFNQ